MYFAGSFPFVHSVRFHLPRGPWPLPQAGGGSSLHGNQRSYQRGPLYCLTGRPCRGATNNRTPHLGPIMEQSAVFMQQCFQSVNNIGDLRKFCHKEAFLSLNKWKNRDPHALQKLTPGSSGRGPGENQGYTMEGGVSAATEMQESS